MRVQYYTILGGKYEGELLSITIPMKRLSHTTGVDVEISGYDIQINQDDGSKVTFENVKLSDVHAVTNCIKCNHCIIEEYNGVCCYSCRFNPSVGIRRIKTDELHLGGSKYCEFWNLLI